MAHNIQDFDVLPLHWINLSRRQGIDWQANSVAVVPKFWEHFPEIARNLGLLYPLNCWREEMKSNILCKIIKYTIKYSLVSRKGNPLEMDEDSFLVGSCLFHNATVMYYASKSWAQNRPSIAAANKSNRFSFPRTSAVLLRREPTAHEFPK